MTNPVAFQRARRNSASEQVLVVVTEQPRWSALKDILGKLGLHRVARASDNEHAMRAVADGVDAAFVFTSLPDRLALHVTMAAAQACPSPKLIVVSDGPHPDLFELARAGAHANLQWPVRADDVRHCLEKPLHAATDLDAAARPLLGRVGLRDAQSLLRYAMLRNALTASQGSRRGAARILGVTRPAVQRMLREDVPELSQAWAEEPRTAPRRVASATNTVKSFEEAPTASRKRRA